MEKGNTKSSAKSASDAKNKDVINKHLRQARVKDGISPRPDSKKMPNPQRTRELYDKRPRNKTGAIYEKYRSQVTDGAVGDPCRHGSKKTNLNHLLNFTVAPYDHWEGNTRTPMHKRSKFPKYNKELFLQANCQFVARDNVDYSIHQKNPDILVDWAQIEEIRFPCHEIPLCPICLYVPIAAKITRCGHIYCWACMLHYLSLTDKPWQKCPICFEAVHKQDLKSVSVKLRTLFSVGGEITLYLMKREKGSLLSLPVMEENLPNSLCNVADVDSVTCYQKLLLASSKEIQLILNKERSQLENAFQNDKETPEVCFIEQAMHLLNEREFNLKHHYSEPIKHSEDHQINICGRKHQISVSSTDSNEDNFELNENDGFGASPTASIVDTEKKGVTFFYQAKDGQHMYLHNLNVRMLIKEFGALEYGPPQITAKLVEVESVTMTEVLRKRLRYLQHLPLTCEFQVVELDFSQAVSRETLMLFDADIKKRRMFRVKKARDERKREKMIQVEENKKLGKYPKATYNLNSAYQFPAYNPEDFASLPNGESNGINAVGQDINSNEHHNSFGRDSDHANIAPESYSGSATSFAQMLRVGPKTFDPTPKERPSPASVQRPQGRRDSDDDEDNECTPAPEYRQSFSDAIQAALDAMSLKEPADNKPSSSKKKKKGKKQQLLFTTSMCHYK